MSISWLLPLVLGLGMGWLVNYFADVLPRTRTLSAPCCRSCNQRIGLADFLLFRNCPSCNTRRGIRSILVSLGLVFSFTWLWYFPQPGVPYPISVCLLTYLAVVLTIDIEHRLILHPVSLVGVLLGLLVGLVLRGEPSILHGLSSTLIGGASGFLIMLAFYYVGEWYVRRMAKKKRIPADEVALGFGDVSLSGIIGLILGWPAVLVGLFFAVLAGGVISLLIIAGMVLAKKYKAFTAIPYAPFLILGAILLLYFL